MTTFTPPALDTLTLEMRDDGVAVLTLNRPDRANSQTVAMFTEYETAGYALRDSGARALVIRGAGEKAFCAGFDLAEIEVITRMGVREFLAFQELAAGGFTALRNLPFPVVAAVHGPAAGGGMSLALAADIRLAAPTAKFACSFVKVGLSAGELGTSWNLSRLVGPGRAAEIAFTGRTVGADEAERIGLVHRVVPSETLFDEVFALATAIAANSPAGVRMSKRALQSNQEVGSYAAALELENRGQALMTRGADMPEALAAFRGRRPPHVTGR
ncbi:enoyl-CoA hydratase/carnithine racemase [Pseudonocardia sediminis]|uniref:Enoyl-CoA hydratase/carnithine racemase n=1 Tax=Pseudonocardia sediminis TaxID=1397368 RepID=A0A4Q7V268_PSEST|nr:enoyl-CoA hydratase/isomerase family protein [Pseudonocardia sediminis]RZT86713.1 enoyl-CoA hydratase/carnithine racemase [Pseudonocardia sediminis]